MSAFNSCGNLTDVYYSGTMTQWNAINFGSGTNPIKSCTIHTNGN